MFGSMWYRIDLYKLGDSLKQIIADAKSEDAPKTIHMPCFLECGGMRHCPIIRYRSLENGQWSHLLCTHDNFTDVSIVNDSIGRYDENDTIAIDAEILLVYSIDAIASDNYATQHKYTIDEVYNDTFIRNQIEAIERSTAGISLIPAIDIHVLKELYLLPY